MKTFVEWRGHALLGLAARLYLAAIFGFACWHKIADPASFALDIATYQILPLELINAMALLLPWVEAAAAVMLVLGLRTRAASLLVAGMMLVFMVALSMALARGLELSCGCFASSGATSDPISWRTLVRDAFWLLLAVYVFAFDRQPIGLDRWLEPRRSAPPPAEAGGHTR